MEASIMVAWNQAVRRETGGHLQVLAHVSQYFETGRMHWLHLKYAQHIPYQGPKHFLSEYWLFIYLIGILDRTQEYFTYTIMDSISLGGNQPVSEGNPWLLQVVGREHWIFKITIWRLRFMNLYRCDYWFQVPAPESKDKAGLIKNDVEAELVTVLVKAFVMVSGKQGGRPHYQKSQLRILLKFQITLKLLFLTILAQNSSWKKKTNSVWVEVIAQQISVKIKKKEHGRFNN